jgi:hypothetical protein
VLLEKKFLAVVYTPSSSLFSVSAISSSTSLLYPYGPAADDTNDTFSDCDDGNALMNVAPGFPLFGKVQTQIRVCIVNRLTYVLISQLRNDLLLKLVMHL